VFVDTNPFKRGIQSNLKVVRGSAFTIDVVVTRVHPAKPLDVYQLDLHFDPNVLRALSVVSGGFLSGGIVIELNLTPQNVNWAEGVLGLPGASGDGILTTITFEAIGEGRSKLELREAILAGVGEDITGKSKHGTVTVSRPRGR
jgi:hypothetical protein